MATQKLISQIRSSNRLFILALMGIIQPKSIWPRLMLMQTPECLLDNPMRIPIIWVLAGKQLVESIFQIYGAKLRVDRRMLRYKVVSRVMLLTTLSPASPLDQAIPTPPARLRPKTSVAPSIQDPIMLSKSVI